MNWSETNNILRPYVSKIESIVKSYTDYSSVRKSVLERNKSRCYFCGGLYPKYMICSRVKNNDLGTMCHMCYIVSHLNYNFSEEITLCYSEIDQREIVRKTVNSIIKTGYVPSIIEIDQNAKMIDISIFEFSNMLIATNNKLPPIFDNYKIFFTNNLNTQIIDVNVSQKAMFIDEHPSVIENLPKYEFNDEEKQCIFKIFNNDPTVQLIDELFGKAQEIKAVHHIRQKKMMLSIKNLYMVFPPSLPSTPFSNI